MRFEPLAIPGAYVIKIEPYTDDRGFFARTFCAEEFAGQGLVDHFAQTSISFNARRGTIRGMHFSVEPHAETKIVRCTAGAIHDVIVDLRQGSETYLHSAGIELSAQNRRAIYIPAGLAHGFQVLADATEVLYMIDIPFVAAAARGIRWNDPAIEIDWPEPISVISERDLQFPDWKP
ncbi:dTDP-4-dehydrorhamnose 3,5-epimerase [Methyloferula stellata]|uniref:dTDP-4-dehydrorhamnose 3,5-epimerase n=1 Tax=Methyloferula stellata TaxID=876270 RepID=UPI000382BDAB|nr:dTDP-4-dehydrorhamnose 3,5-epimerase [Methyloferula stellata]